MAWGLATALACPAGQVESLTACYVKVRDSKGTGVNDVPAARQSRAPAARRAGRIPYGVLCESKGFEGHVKDGESKSAERAPFEAG